MITIGELISIMNENGISAVNPAGQSGRCFLSYDRKMLLVDDEYEEDAAYEDLGIDLYEAISTLPDSTLINVMGMEYDVFITQNMIVLDEKAPQDYEDDAGDAEDKEPVHIDDVTGTIGSWLDNDMSEIPGIAKAMLAEAYKLCCDALDGKEV